MEEEDEEQPMKQQEYHNESLQDEIREKRDGIDGVLQGIV